MSKEVSDMKLNLTKNVGMLLLRHLAHRDGPAANSIDRYSGRPCFTASACYRRWCINRA